MFSEAYWSEWAKREEGNYAVVKGKPVYKKKGYLHLDQRFWFPSFKDEIKTILKDNLKIPNVKEKRTEFYQFSPFIKLLLKTPRYRYQFEEGHYDLETKIRPICFAAHRDSLIMGYYSHALTKLYEKYIHRNNFDDVVLAYRSDLGLCNIQFAKEIFDQVKVRKACSTVALDIKGYFDHIDHIILKEKWQQILGGRLPEDQFRLFNILTKYSYITQKSLLKKYKGPKKRDEVLPNCLMDIVPGSTILEKFKQLKKDQLIVTNDKPDNKTKRYRGIPQGSPISALLSNIYLIDFDKDLKEKADKEGFIYRRYCDDILLICDTDKASELMDHVIDKISKEYFLTIQTAKVDLIDFRSNSKGKIRGFRRTRSTKSGQVKISRNPVVTTSINEEKYYKALQYLGFEYNGKNIIIRSSSLSRFFRKLNHRLTRTVTMAYSPKTKSDQIFLRQIYERYTHLGTRNFLTYAFNASKKIYQSANGMLSGMNSPAIRKQVASHFSLLRAELASKNIKWFSHKSKGKKIVTPKYFS